MMAVVGGAWYTQLCPEGYSLFLAGAVGWVPCSVLCLQPILTPVGRSLVPGPWALWLMAEVAQG